MKSLLKSMTIGLSFIIGLQAAEPTVDVKEEIKNHETIFPREITDWILIQTLQSNNYGDRILKLGYEVSFVSVFSDLSCVCKGWRDIIHGKNGFETKKILITAIISAYEKIKHGKACCIFLDGRLRYTPDPNLPKIFTDLFIADLEKPFSGEFDLSLLGDSGEYLSICTGYRKMKRNIDRVEIWFYPWFVMDRDMTLLPQPSDKNENKPGWLTQLVSYVWNNKKPVDDYKDIFKSWNKDHPPVGVKYNWGSCNNLEWWDCVTNQNIGDMCSKNLLKFYNLSRAAYYGCLEHRVIAERQARARKFSFLF